MPTDDQEARFYGPMPAALARRLVKKGQDQDGGRGGSVIDSDTARAWLDAQLARQGITARTITNRTTLAKLATLFYAGLDNDPRSSSSPEGESPKGRTRGRSAGQRRSE
jgi:hypothetical protein